MEADTIRAFKVSLSRNDGVISVEIVCTTFFAAATSKLRRGCLFEVIHVQEIAMLRSFTVLATYKRK